MNNLLGLTKKEDDGREFLRVISQFYSATFDMLNDEIPNSDWFAKLGDLVGCENVGCVWWPEGQHKKYRSSFLSADTEVPVTVLSHVDHFLSSHDRQEGFFLDELLPNSPLKDPEQAAPALTPEKLVACLDWHPARVIIVFERNKSSGKSWTDVDRELLGDLLPTLRKSVTIKKSLSFYKDQVDLANKVFDCWPRAVFTVLPTREALGRNRVARKFFEEASFMKLVDGHVVFINPEMHREFKEQLMVVRGFPQDRITEYGWFKSIANPNGGNPLVLTMRALLHDNWRIESSPEERAVVILIGGNE